MLRPGKFGMSYCCTTLFGQDDIGKEMKRFLSLPGGKEYF
jgi:hypothetical protein